MSDFDALLRRTLSVVNENYESSLNVVKGVVQKLGEAIEKNAGDEFLFAMTEVNSDINGSVHKIFLDPNNDDDSVRLVIINYVLIPSTGFPIKLGKYSKTMGFMADEDDLNDPEDVNKYFSRLLEDPNSKLIQAIGYALRLKANRNENDK